MAIFGRKKDKKEPAPAEAAGERVKSVKDLYSGEALSGKTGTGGAADVKKTIGSAYKILAKPLVTEKVSNLGALNKYVFAVAPRANKIEVARAIKQIYGIKPEAVNIINLAGKKARYGRASGRRKNWKKAIVTLPEGKTIKIYEGV